MSSQADHLEDFAAALERGPLAAFRSWLQFVCRQHSPPFAPEHNCCAAKLLEQPWGRGNRSAVSVQLEILDRIEEEYLLRGQSCDCCMAIYVGATHTLVVHSKMMEMGEQVDAIFAREPA